MAPVAAETEPYAYGAAVAPDSANAGSPLVASAGAAAAEAAEQAHAHQAVGDVSRGTVAPDDADLAVHEGLPAVAQERGEQQASAAAGVPHTGAPAGPLPDDLGEESIESTHDRNDEKPVTDADKAPQLLAGDPASSADTTTDGTAGPRRSSRLDSDEGRRAALVESLPAVTDDTPLMAELQQDARRRIELRGRRFPQPQSTRIITVANQKGGVGKTTTTVNLAAALAQSGLNVLVLDNDPQGNASTALGVEHRAGTPSIYEVLVEGAPISEAVQQSPDVENLWCLPATIDLSGAEIELVSMVARETRLRNALDTYLEWRIQNGQAPIDYVFVDCPPSLGLLTVNAFVVGREVLIPIQCEYYALEGLSQLLKTIQLIQAHLNPELHVSTILLTMYDARTNLAQQVAGEVRTHFPERTLRTTVPRSVRISEAPSYGQTVMTYDAGSSGALAYLEAARELAERGADGVGPSTSPDDERSAGASASAGSTNGSDSRGVMDEQNAPTQADESHRDQVRMNEPAMAATQEEQ
ncbi:AAA family ATPase [Cellulomonas sp.]|uniref:AAA family ATPase n=1 Tax=Cellulomonas sp. TaxID=40001 RepID=UPI0025C45BC5|nr:AAA family ATPase [Cellulomonas sp.]